LAREYSVDSLLWLSQAWELFKLHWKYYIPWGFLNFVVLICTIWIWPLIFVLYPLSAGLWFATFNVIRTTGSNKLEALDFFQGFRWIGPLAIIFIFQGATIGLGLLLLILPGLYVLSCIAFSGHLYLEYCKEDIFVMDSIKICYLVCQKKYWHILGFICINTLVCFSGVLLFGLGLVITVPLSCIATCYAVRDIFGLRDHHRYCIEHNLP